LLLTYIFILFFLFKGHSEYVRVTYVKDPTDFYVQKLSSYTLLDNIEVEIEKYVEKNSTLPSNINISKDE
jgi:hypothetical protein